MRIPDLRVRPPQPRITDSPAGPGDWRASLAVDAVLAELLPQRGAVDPEQRRGLGLLALAQLEHAQDMGALQLVERRHVIAAERLQRGRRGRRAPGGDV